MDMEVEGQKTEFCSEGEMSENDRRMHTGADQEDGEIPEEAILRNNKATRSKRPRLSMSIKPPDSRCDSRAHME